MVIFYPIRNLLRIDDNLQIQINDFTSGERLVWLKIDGKVLIRDPEHQCCYSKENLISHATVLSFYKITTVKL